MGATQKIIDRIQLCTEKRPNSKTMQEDGHWYYNQVSGTFTFEVFAY